MNKIISLIVFFLFTSGVFGQQHQIGIKAGLYTFYYYGSGPIGNWYLEALSSVVSGKTICGYYKFNLNHFYLESQLLYTYNLSTIYSTNLTPERDYGGNHVFSTNGGCEQLDLGLGVTAGVQAAFKGVRFRGFAGLTPCVLIKTHSTDIFVADWDEINKSIYTSYESFILYGNWGIGVDYWRFSLDIKRENNLTPIISSIEYEGATYDYNLSTKRLYLILGFNFYPWKIKDQSPKPPI
jgi:hypothetical protein